MHQHRDRYSQDRLEHDIDQDVLDGHQQRVPEQLVLEEFGEVVETDEMRCSEQVVPGQTEVEAADEGVEVEHQESDGGGEDEDHRHAQITLAGRSIGTSYSGLVISGNEGLDCVGGHALAPSTLRVWGVAAGAIL